MKLLKTSFVFCFLLVQVPQILAQEAEPEKKQADTLKVYSKFDFIPGAKILFFDDFSTEAIGDFPARWNTNSTGEIITTNLFAGRWLHLKGEGFYIPETQGNFTDNFTVEFDVVPTNELEEENGSLGFSFSVISGDINNPNEGGAIPGKAGNRLYFDNWTLFFSSYADGEYKLNGSTDYVLIKNKQYHISVWIQKQRIRFYVNERKLYDLPRGMPEGFAYNIIRFDTDNDSHPMIGNFRIAMGLPDLRNKLMTEGKLISYGIYFDANSDKVKPQSNSTLKEIAQVLKENAGVKIKIVGYTDSDGDNAANLDLSKRRAMAVKQELVTQFGIDSTRIDTDGKGETLPVAPNDNSSNKAKNRRVEFIKM